MSKTLGEQSDGTFRNCKVCGVPLDADDSDDQCWDCLAAYRCPVCKTGVCESIPVPSKLLCSTISWAICDECGVCWPVEAGVICTDQLNYRVQIRSLSEYVPVAQTNEIESYSAWSLDNEADRKVILRAIRRQVRRISKLRAEQ